MPKPVTPLLTADAIIEHRGAIVLIERRFEPLGFAIPGGFVDVGESIEAAAIREAKEETGLDVELLVLLGIYSNPKRDHRGHNATSIFIARADDQQDAVAGDDAGSIHYWQPGSEWPNLAFDHRMVLEDYLEYKKSGVVPSPGLQLQRASGST